MTHFPSLAANPVLSRWLDLGDPGVVRVRTGKVELGQGILTALAQVVVDELGVSPERVAVSAASTDAGPAEGFTAGSLSVTQSGSALRHACRVLLGLLSARVAATAGCAPAELVLTDGRFEHAGREVGDLWNAAAQGGLDVDATGDAGVAAAVAAADAPPMARLDLPDKVLGRPRYLHDLRVDGLVHGRVVRPPRPGARLDSVDVAVVDSTEGVVAVVREGSFLGVVADDEHAADVAAAALARTAVWSGGSPLPPDVPSWLRDQPAETSVVVGSNPSPDVTDATLRASYSRPPLAHASIAPSCGIARWDGHGVRIWTHSQGVHPLRAAVAQALGLDPVRVEVQHVEGAGCYGHNGADDAAFDAVLLARHADGRPVRVQWTRADELAWSPVGAAMAVDVAATLGPDGCVSDWSHTLWSNGHTARPGYAGQPGLLGDAHRRDADPVPSVDPPEARGHGSARNAVPGYDFGRVEVLAHRALRMPLRTSALRSLGAHLNVFAIESFLDELAAKAGANPLDFRLAHLRDERAAAVLRLAAERGAYRDPRPDDVGRGIAYARYKGRGAWCAVVAEVEAVDRVAVRRLTVAVDVGRAVSLDGVRNQLEGGAIQATSWTVTEQVRTGADGVQSTDWETYPILRFSHVPRVEVHVVDRPDEPSVGAGEAAQGPTAAAIANALHDAIGVRVRDLPVTADRVAAAIEAG